MSNDDLGDEPAVFGERLRFYREAAGLSAAQLAVKVGVVEGSIRQMESGQTKNATFPNGLRIADALGVDPWKLAGEKRPQGVNQGRPPDDVPAEWQARLEALEARFDLSEQKANETLALVEKTKLDVERLTRTLAPAPAPARPVAVRRRPKNEGQ